METNKQLLKLTAQRDQLAFKKLYDQTSGKLYPLALYLLKREVLAEELLQDVYLKIWNSAAQYKLEQGTALGWMKTITRNLAFDKLRYLKVQMRLN